MCRLKPGAFMPESTPRAKLLMALKEFKVKKVSLRDGDPWILKDGALVHKSDGYFGVVGARFDGYDPADSVLLYQPQSAIAGLLVRMDDAGPCFLLQARVEPGLVNGAQFAPTVQSTLANYLRFHGGLPTPHIDYFTTFKVDALPHCESSQLDFGERYLMKVKRSAVIEITAETPAMGNMVWMTGAELREAVMESHYLDMDLRSLLALAPWAPTTTGFCLEPASAAIRASLAGTLRPDVLGRMLASLDGSSSFRGFVPLDSLANWDWSEQGLFEKNPIEGFSVEFFETRTLSREVGSWIQPLINSHSSGRVVLFLRQTRGIAEVFVRISQERGHPKGVAVSASHVRDPGRPISELELIMDQQCRSARVLARTEECDEGGRFFQDMSTYEVIEVDGLTDLQDGMWVTVAELKFLLGCSQVCTMQLRAVSSMLLGLKI
jgi:oxidase EvaA